MLLTFFHLFLLTNYLFFVIGKANKDVNWPQAPKMVFIRKDNLLAQENLGPAPPIRIFPFLLRSIVIVFVFLYYYVIFLLDLDFLLGLLGLDRRPTHELIKRTYYCDILVQVPSEVVLGGFPSRRWSR